MTFSHDSKPMAMSALAVLWLAASPVDAQTSTRSAPAPTPLAPLVASAPAMQPATRPVFSSVLDSYQPYAEDKMANWKQANDTTARIGGWRTYAKEAAEPEPAPAKPPAPAIPALPVLPASGTKP